MNEKRGKKNIWLLASSSLFNDAGSEIITPILPFFIDSMGGGGVALGLLSGLREGLSSLLKFFGGWFSDRIGKRMPFVFIGYFLSIILKFCLGFATSWQQLIAFVSFERIGKLRDAPRDALITSSTKNRGKGFSIHQMMDTSGGIIGTLLAILLLVILGLEYKTIIFIAAGISLLSLLPLFFVKEEKSLVIKRNIFQGFKHMDKHLIKALVIVCVFALASFGLYSFIILRVKQLTGNFLLPLILYSLFHITGAIFVMKFGKLSDKIGRKPVLLIGYGLFVLSAIGFAFFSNIYSLAILFMIYGLAFTITESVQRAFISDMADEAKGTIMGVYHGLRGMVSIAAGIIAGLLWDVSPTIMFSYLAIVGFIALILLSLYKNKYSDKSSKINLKIPSKNKS